MKINNMRKKIWLLFLMSFMVLSATIVSTYALFEDNASGNVVGDIGAWIIKLNEILISNSEVTEIAVSNFTYDTNSNINTGVIAPGGSGYYDIVLDATGTEVAIKYTISFDLTQITSENVELEVEVLDGDNVTSLGNGVYTGIFSLEDIEDNPEITLRMKITWVDDPSYDETDTEIGRTYNSNLHVPVAINVIQYLEEEPADSSSSSSSSEE